MHGIDSGSGGWLASDSHPSSRPKRGRNCRSRLSPSCGAWCWLPWAAGLAIAIALHFTLDLSWVYCGAAGLLVALLGGQLEVMLVERRTNKIENQLADAIDLMVSGFRAGAGVLNSLDNAAHESRRPLREQFEEIVGRIRLGDDAQEVFGELAARVPLESFMLFSSALSVHWEVGGSLAPTLATVGRTIRDRIELTRRIHSMTAQSRMSIIGVLLGTYAIAAIMWSNDPERMESLPGERYRYRALRRGGCHAGRGHSLVLSHGANQVLRFEIMRLFVTLLGPRSRPCWPS